MYIVKVARNADRLLNCRFSEGGQVMQPQAIGHLVTHERVKNIEFDRGGGGYWEVTGFKS